MRISPTKMLDSSKPSLHEWIEKEYVEIYKSALRTEEPEIINLSNDCKMVIEHFDLRKLNLNLGKLISTHSNTGIECVYSSCMPSMPLINAS